MVNGGGRIIVVLPRPPAPAVTGLFRVSEDGIPPSFTMHKQPQPPHIPHTRIMSFTTCSHRKMQPRQE